MGERRQSYNWIRNSSEPKNSSYICINYELVDEKTSNDSQYEKTNQEKPNPLHTVSDKASPTEATKDIVTKSPIQTPWSRIYFNKKNKEFNGKVFLPSYNLIDAERMVQTQQSPKHSDDNIYRRHFINEGDQDNFEREKWMNTSFHPVEFSTDTVVHSQQNKSLETQRGPKKASFLDPTKKKIEPSKSKSSHHLCLSNFNHNRRRPLRSKCKEIDSFVQEVTVDQQGLKESWENHVLGKLSNETRRFISHRFEGRSQPREKLVDFLDAGYRDKDRNDYMTKRKVRLFDMPYQHEEFPGPTVSL